MVEELGTACPSTPNVPETSAGVGITWVISDLHAGDSSLNCYLAVGATVKLRSRVSNGGDAALSRTVTVAFASVKRMSGQWHAFRFSIIFLITVQRNR